MNRAMAASISSRSVIPAPWRRSAPALPRRIAPRRARGSYVFGLYPAGSACTVVPPEIRPRITGVRKK